MDADGLLGATCGALHGRWGTGRCMRLGALRGAVWSLPLLFGCSAAVCALGPRRCLQCLAWWGRLMRFGGQLGGGSRLCMDVGPEGV